MKINTVRQPFARLTAEIARQLKKQRVSEKAILPGGKLAVKLAADANSPFIGRDRRARQCDPQTTLESKEVFTTEHFYWLGTWKPMGTRVAVAAGKLSSSASPAEAN